MVTHLCTPTHSLTHSFSLSLSLSLFLSFSPFLSPSLPLHTPIKSVYSTGRLSTPSHTSIHFWTIYLIKNSISRYSQGILFHYSGSSKGLYYLQIRSSESPTSDRLQLSHRLRSGLIRGATSRQLQDDTKRRIFMNDRPFFNWLLKIL